MSTLKKILIAIALIIALPFVIALFLGNDYEIKREIVIKKPQQEVFDYIKLLKNQDNYSKWVMTDPNMNKEFTGEDGTKGFIYAWDSKMDEAGKGAQEIIGVTDGVGINVEVRFEKPMKGLAYTPIKTEAISTNETKVIWGMNGKSTYPLNFMNMFMDNILGKDLEISLETLKKILEQQ